MAIKDADRDRLTAALAEHHAAGRLTLEQLEERVEAVFLAESLEQAVETALTGMPPLPQQRARRSPRGHGEADSPGPGWIATSERFRDPTSGRIMRVWIDAVNGARHYLADRD
jgi:hypothetical protein